MTAINNAGNQKFVNNGDGFIVGGGATERDLTVTSGNITMTGGSGNTFTFPAATSTLASLGLAETFGGQKTFTQNVLLTAKLGTYNNVATVGEGVPAIYGTGRVTAQVAAAAAIATYTNGAADGSFLVSGNINVTAVATASFSMTVTYTDETNTSRTLNLSFSQTTGTILSVITNVTGTGAYEGVPLHIRVKASTAITFATAGTFTSVTYNAEGYITQIG